MKLTNASTGQVLVSNLEVASNFWTRTKGLLGRDGLSEDQALWILRCNSVHTYFMKFSLDLIFLNKKMVVVDTGTNVRPGRLVLPVWRATSVIELKSGFLEKNPVRIGEQLHVDHSLS